jgi:hypothetical protein
MDINVKTIGNIPIERWREAFGKAVAITMDNDDFGDILFCELYPNTFEEILHIEKKDDKAACDIYNEKWDYANEAFKAVFGFDRYGKE